MSEVIKSVQRDLKIYFDTSSKEEVEEIKQQLQRIACAKDIDVIYAMFKPDLDVGKLEDNKEEDNDEVDENVTNKTSDETINSSKDHLTQASIDEANNLSNLLPSDSKDPAHQAQVQENAMKVLKQHLEITKLKEQLKETTNEKAELEEEISNRNKEIYEMNEKIILMEMNQETAREKDLNTIQDLKALLDRQNRTQKAAYSFSKFKDKLDQLRSDLELLKLSDKFGQNRNKRHFDDSNGHEEEMLGDNLADDKNDDNLEDSNNSIKNLSSDKLVLDNIQKSIELIELIQKEIEDQEKAQTDGDKASEGGKKQKMPNDTENTTTIMQDIDMINWAVGDNVEANREDSFLNSMYSDVNASKFIEKVSKYPVSASTYSEKDNSDNKNLSEQDKEKQQQEDLKKEEDQKLEKSNTERLKNDYYKLESNFGDVKAAKDKLFKELVHSRHKVDAQDKQIQDKDMRIAELEQQAIAFKRDAEKSKIKFNQVMNGMPMQSMGGMMGGYVFPENNNGSVQYNTYGSVSHHNDRKTSMGSQEGTDHTFSQDAGTDRKVAPPPSFFNRKVVKPIRGGGKKHQPQTVAIDPYNQNSVPEKELKRVHKLPPSNPFTPIVRPGNELANNHKLASQKSFKQIRKESKKSNYKSNPNL